MSFWRNQSISTKIVAAFTLVFVSAVWLGLFGLAQTASINEKAADVRDNWLPSTVLLGKFAAQIKEFRIKEARILISTEDSDLTAQTNDVGLLRNNSDRRRANVF